MFPRYCVHVMAFCCYKSPTPLYIVSQLCLVYGHTRAHSEEKLTYVVLLMPVKQNNITILNDGVKLTIDDIIDDKFNRFCISIGKSLSSKNRRDPLYYITSTVNSISIPQFIESDILAVM